MSNKLIIDTSKKSSYIIVTYEDKMMSRILNEQTKVSENLLPTIDSLLAEFSISLQDLDCFCVVTGPGSFTGIRVGISTIKAFCQALGKKMVAKTSFEILNKNICDGVLCMKCTGTSMYYAKYDKFQLVDFGVVANDEIQNMSNNNEIYQIENELCYDGDSCIIKNYIDILNASFEEFVVNGEFVNFEQVEPFYIQASQAEIALIAKGNQDGKN